MSFLFGKIKGVNRFSSISKGKEQRLEGCRGAVCHGVLSMNAAMDGGYYQWLAKEEISEGKRGGSGASRWGVGFGRGAGCAVWRPCAHFAGTGRRWRSLRITCACGTPVPAALAQAGAGIRPKGEERQEMAMRARGVFVSRLETAERTWRSRHRIASLPAGAHNVSGAFNDKRVDHSATARLHLE
jgi:hypothetical protein